MNKSEEMIFKSSANYKTREVVSFKTGYSSMDTERNEIKLEQDKDINKNQYQFEIYAQPQNDVISKVSYFKNGEWNDAPVVTMENRNKYSFSENYTERFENGKRAYLVNLNFNDRTEKIRFEYKNEIVDPIELSVIYIEADKEEYYKKQFAQKRSELIKEMSVVCRTGDALVSVFWKNATNEVKKTVIEFFLDNHQPFMKSELDSDTTFKSVQGLADGAYLFKLSQLDKDGNLIVETDMIFFRISCSEIHGEHVVVI